MVNYLYFYTNDCAICGQGTVAKINDIRPQVEEKKMELVVKQVPLFTGWQAEAKEIGAKIPFFFNPQTNMVAEYQDIFTKDKNNTENINQKNLSLLLESE